MLFSKFGKKEFMCCFIKLIKSFQILKHIFTCYSQSLINHSITAVFLPIYISHFPNTQSQYTFLYYPNSTFAYRLKDAELPFRYSCPFVVFLYGVHVCAHAYMCTFLFVPILSFEIVFPILVSQSDKTAIQI